MPFIRAWATAEPIAPVPAIPTFLVIITSFCFFSALLHSSNMPNIRRRLRLLKKQNQAIMILLLTFRCLRLRADGIVRYISSNLLLR